MHYNTLTISAIYILVIAQNEYRILVITWGEAQPMSSVANKDTVQMNGACLSLTQKIKAC